MKVYMYFKISKGLKNELFNKYDVFSFAPDPTLTYFNHYARHCYRAINYVKYARIWVFSDGSSQKENMDQIEPVLWHILCNVLCLLISLFHCILCKKANIEFQI